MFKPISAATLILLSVSAVVAAITSLDSETFESDFIKSLKEKGILILTRSARGAAEEAPEAYKDIHEVALSTEMAGLARRVAMVKPKICVKG